MGNEFCTPQKIPRWIIKTYRWIWLACVSKNNYQISHYRKWVSCFTTVSLSFQQNIDFSGGKWALYRIIRDLGFRWWKSENNREVLIAKDDIRAARMAYLINIFCYRCEGPPIIHSYGTYIHLSHTKFHAWGDVTNAGLLAPVSKGQRVIILNVGSENIFISKVLSMSIGNKFWRVSWQNEFW